MTIRTTYLKVTWDDHDLDDPECDWPYVICMGGMDCNEVEPFDMDPFLSTIKKMGRLLPGPRGGEVMFTAEEWEVVKEANAS